MKHHMYTTMSTGCMHLSIGVGNALSSLGLLFLLPKEKCLGLLFGLCICYLLT